MKKIYFVLIFSIVIISLHAQTTPTLSNNNMPGSGDTLRYTNIQMNSVGNYTQTGTNYNWDFSTVVSTTSDIREFKSALQTPYAFLFLGFNEYGEKIADTLVAGTGSISITKYYNFYKKQTSPNAFVADGVGMNISGVPVPSYYSDKDELYMFPLTYPKYDSTTFKFSSLSTTIIPITYTKAGYRVTRVDGWGTVKTPYGTDNCIRLITTQYSKDTTKVTLPIPGLPPIKIGIQNNVRSYQWMTLNSKIPYFEVTGNLIGANFTPTQIRYRGYNKVIIPPPNSVGLNVTDMSSLELYPNPVADKIWLNVLENKDYELEVFNLEGKLVKSDKLETFGNIGSVDVSGISQGLYHLKIKTGTEEKSIKFIKQ